MAVYQEQLMRIARDLAGFSLSEADILRKAVGKKIKKLLDKQRAKLIQGMVNNKINKTVAEKIWKMVEPFAGYGFVRAHAACYALIAYQTAYFKANYPDEFMASLLTSDYGDIDRIAIEVEECEQMGIKVLPPDINESFSTFTAVYNPKTKKPEKKIRFGLLAIKNVGTNIVKTIIKERKTGGNFKNLEDFLTRVQTKDLNKKSLESLIRSGALDEFGERNQLLQNINSLLTLAKSAEKEALNGQTNLFGALPTTNAPKLKLKKIEPASRSKKLSWEKELLGLYVSDHPLKEHEEYLKNITTPITELNNHLNKNSNVKIGGIITNIQKVITRNGKPMLFVKVEDASGRLEILVFPTILEKTINLWQEEKIILAKGKISDKEGVIKLLCNEAEEIDFTAINNQQPSKNIHLIVSADIKPQTFTKLKNLLLSSPGPYRVHLHIESAMKTKTLTTKLFITEDCFDNIGSIIGGQNIRILN